MIDNFSLMNIIKYIKKLSVFQKVFFGIFFIFACASLYVGIDNALTSSQDFQWSPSLLLSEGINPYSYYLKDGDKDCVSCLWQDKIIGTQAPNYAHALYVILLPFTKLDWNTAQIAWAIVNIILSMITFFILAKKSGLETISLFFLLCIYFASTPFRNSIGAGQQSILILFAFTYSTSGYSFSNLLSGLAYLKYSFAPPLALYMILKNKGVGFLISLVIPLFGFFIFYTMQSEESLLPLLTQPLFVNSLSVGNGLSDYMTIASLLIGDNSEFVDKIYIYIFPVIIALILTFILVRRSHDALFELTIISLISLLFFKHLIYDYVFLLPALFFSVKHFDSIFSKLSLLCISYFWFGIRFLYTIETYSIYENILPTKILNFIILLTILIMIVMTQKHKTS
jgi:hypothetical protein